MATGLKRTTIFLTEEQHENLRKIAFDRRTSMSKLLREAVLEIMEDEEDVREGLKELENKEGTVTIQEYVLRRSGRGA